MKTPWCGCSVKIDWPNKVIVYCPMHAAMPELYKAAHEAMWFIFELRGNLPYEYFALKEALAKARGEESTS